jgi:hypothetical protein
VSVEEVEVEVEEAGRKAAHVWEPQLLRDRHRPHAAAHAGRAQRRRRLAGVDCRLQPRARQPFLLRRRGGRGRVRVSIV